MRIIRKFCDVLAIIDLIRPASEISLCDQLATINALLPNPEQVTKEEVYARGHSLFLISK